MKPQVKFKSLKWWAGSDFLICPKNKNKIKTAGIPSDLLAPTEN